MRLHIRPILFVLAAPTFVACASFHRSSRTLPPDAAVTLSSSEVTMLRRMTDANILGHMAMADSVELVMAALAQRRSRNDAVVEFARMMIADHTTSLEAERSLGRQQGIGIQTMVGELNMSHMGSMVDSVGPQISEINFDHNYIVSQVQVHQHILAELQTLQGVARAPAVRDHIAVAIPVVTRHLIRAHDIAVQRGYMGRNRWTM